jgi:hypothetical protein
MVQWGYMNAKSFRNNETPNRASQEHIDES